MEGEGFERLSSSSYVTLIEDGGGTGTLNDGGSAIAMGEARDSMDLESYVLAKTNDGAGQSAAQVVQLTTTVLQSTEQVEKVRVEIDTEMDVSLAGGAIAIYEVEGEATLDGHPMAEVKTKLYLYPWEDGIEIYLGPRSPEKSPVATMENGAKLDRMDPSFYFGLGPGVYKLLLTLKLSVVCPGEAPAGVGSIRASSRIGLR